MQTTVQQAVQALGEFAAGVDTADLDGATKADLDLVLLDTVGVTLAGAATSEVQGLVERLPTCPGPARLLGHGRSVATEQAALLNGTAACVLELDEGNKHARGHPAAHVVPAALALAAECEVSGAELCAALLAGHEVASRFGRALRPVPGLHPHGHWGALGAATAAARLLGCPASGIAGAIDAAGGLVLATPFESALEGSFVRNLWIGAANQHGLTAARLAAAGLAGVDGTPGHSLGGILGELDPAVVVEDLGARWDVSLGYLKRHAACSYTHPPADAALELARRHGIAAESVRSVLVETHGLAAPLSRQQPSTRLAAMFSIPHVVAAALVHGEVGPEATSERAREDPLLRGLAERATVRHEPSFDERAPAERPARVTLTLDDGAVHTLEVPNPVGDADHHPLDLAAVRGKLSRLLGDEAAKSLEATLSGLADAPRARTVLDDLP